MADDATVSALPRSSIGWLVFTFSWMPFWLLLRLVSESKSLCAQRAEKGGCYPIHKHFVVLFAVLFADGVRSRLTIEGFFGPNPAAGSWTMGGGYVMLGWWQIFPSGLPLSLDVLSMILGWLSVGGIFWIHEHLAQNWSPFVQSAQVKQLVRTGPYAYCRHPMYFDFGLLLVSMNLAAPCWECILTLLFAIVLFARRVGAEDRIMEDLFGDEFRQWKRVTPAVLPHGAFCKGPAPYDPLA
jgi:protein-S-isoprenylcysteine O-methyltransferase Ste14